MNDTLEPRAEPPEQDESVALEDLGHPRGTLAIVVLYGLLFALGWLGIYVFQFLGRGAPHP